MQRAPSEPHHEIVNFLVGRETRHHMLVAFLAQDAFQKVVIELERHARLRQAVAAATGLAGWSIHRPKISHSSAVLRRAA